MKKIAFLFGGLLVAMPALGAPLSYKDGPEDNKSRERPILCDWRESLKGVQADDACEKEFLSELSARAKSISSVGAVHLCVYKFFDCGFDEDLAMKACVNMVALLSKKATCTVSADYNPQSRGLENSVAIVNAYSQAVNIKPLESQANNEGIEMQLQRDCNKETREDREYSFKRISGIVNQLLSEQYDNTQRLEEILIKSIKRELLYWEK